MEGLVNSRMQTDCIPMQTDKLKYKDLSYKVIGIMYKVHSALGCGFSEKIYQKAIELELTKQGIPYETEKTLKVVYDGVTIGMYRLDLLIDQKIIIELKAVEKLAKIFKEQLISQLKASPFEVGLLVNFGSPKLEYLRIYRAK